MVFILHFLFFESTINLQCRLVIFRSLLPKKSGFSVYHGEDSDGIYSTALTHIFTEKVAALCRDAVLVEYPDLFFVRKVNTRDFTKGVDVEGGLIPDTIFSATRSSNHGGVVHVTWNPGNTQCLGWESKQYQEYHRASVYIGVNGKEVIVIDITEAENALNTLSRWPDLRLCGEVGCWKEKIGRKRDSFLSSFFLREGAFLNDIKISNV